MGEEKRAPKPRGEIQFLEHHWPTLPAGDYRIEVSQQISADHDKIPESSFTGQQRRFSVLGPRFSLEPGLIRTVFPPRGSLGEHSSVLPHVTFTRSTLPWERHPEPLTAAEDEALAKQAMAALHGLTLREEADKLVHDGETSVARGKDFAAEGARLVEAGKGQGTVRGRGLVSRGKLLVAKGKQLVTQGEQVAAQGRQLREKGEGLVELGTLKKQTPWLALLLFDQDEIDEKHGPGSTADGDPKPAILGTCELVEEASVWRLEARPRLPQEDKGLGSPTFAKEQGQHAGDPVQVIEVETRLLREILPSKNDVRWLAHARRATDEHGQPISDELATLLCNRMPAPGRSSIVHLVSLDGAYKQGDIWRQANAGDHERIRMVSLASWRFSCVDEKQSFKGLLHHLNESSRAVQRPGPGGEQANDLATAAPGRTGLPWTLCLPSAGLAEARPYVLRGCVAVPHETRQGNRLFSWYHGPLAPGKAVEAWPEKILPARNADQLVRYQGDCVMFDISYAAAWELGRLLTLQEESVAVALLEWKRRQRHVQERDRARRQLLHLPLEGQGVDAGLPEKVRAWFHDISLLKGVPFNYLVPDERMLPQESLRFFRIDSRWVECLLDGAFSIGRVLPQDHARDADHVAGTKPHAAPHPVASGLLLRSELVAGWPDLQVDGYADTYLDEDFVEPGGTERVELPSAEAELLQQALDGSDVKALRKAFPRLAKDYAEGELRVFPSALPPPTAGDGERHAAWVVNVGQNREILHLRRTGGTFTLQLEKRLHLLRMERLSPSVLLCLFAGDIQTVDIHQKPEALHFGFNRPKEPDSDAYYRELKNSLGGELTDVVEHVLWKDQEKRVVDAKGLSGKMWTNHLSEERGFGKTWTPAQFALQMAEGVQKVRFPCRVKA